MLTYSEDNHEIMESLSTAMIKRRTLDCYLDDVMKKQIINHPSELCDAISEMYPIVEAVRQIEALRETHGILFAETEGDLAEAAFEEGYDAAFLTDEKLKHIPKQRRIAIAKSLLEIMCTLDELQIYPGIINTNAIVYDQSGSSDQVYLARVSRFQLGTLRQTWDEISDESYHEDNVAMHSSYIFFNEVCQNVAYARVINRIIKDARLRKELACEECFSPFELMEIMEYTEEDLLRPVVRKTGVWVLASDPITYEDSARYAEETALLNTMLLSAAPNTEQCPLSANYIWCGRSCDVRGGSGAVYSTGMKNFSGTYIPDVPFPKKGLSQKPSTGSNLMKAFLLAAYEIQHSDCDNKLLIILAPRSTDNNITSIINRCRSSEMKNSFVVLFNNWCHWDTTKEAGNLLNTDNPEDLEYLYSWICSRTACEDI